ncbi:MAG TPA: hypothetical protein VI750_06610 [Pyrinomonadaceae bacterium]|nr:hypothetical protein [Pyrinomonadaceae bacterium]
MFSKEAAASNLAKLSRKTGLVVRPLDSSTLDALFTELEKYDARERAETLDYLQGAINETRGSLGAEPAYSK